MDTFKKNKATGGAGGSERAGKDFCPLFALQAFMVELHDSDSSYLAPVLSAAQANVPAIVSAGPDG